GAGALQQINLLPDGVTTQLGQLDPASGLVYYNSSLGGRMVVDPRSGTVSFPDVPPGRNDVIFASYIPQVMRLNTSRDESNIYRPDGYGNFPLGANDPAFKPLPATTTSGNNMNPVAIWDRSSNPRAVFTAPQVVFQSNGAAWSGPGPEVDRLWVLYRKTDPSSNTPGAIVYKAMRLMIRLPRPPALTTPNSNGQQQLAGLTVTGNLGPYEVDWTRGRIYFTQVDENSQVTVNYTYKDPATNNSLPSGALTYTVTWGDEISSTAQAANSGQPYTDVTTPEVFMPTDASVNEGQVAAFLDPFSEKVWVFWTSTRASTTDLYYQTLAPQFYPAASNQQ
ncbi:MAG TPA: hypothetical protein VGS41_16530, partial [Chthonomonadales bacterium]|nr:hypothetical protein [Chthonomonadales bacterium]